MTENKFWKSIEDIILNESSKRNMDEKEWVSYRLHCIVLENQLAIFDLVKEGHIGPAYALLRITFETHVKALWIYKCATDRHVKQFKEDKLTTMTLHKMIEDLESTDLGLEGSLKELKCDIWKKFNSYTHSGSMQINRIFEPNQYDQYPIDFSTKVAISSFAAIGILLGNKRFLDHSIQIAEQMFEISI